MTNYGDTTVLPLGDVGRRYLKDVKTGCYDDCN